MSFTASAANVNFGYWSHDIGGFYEPVGGELYTRWVQWGVLSPLFRAHGFRRADMVKRVWHFAPPFVKAMRRAIRFRLELLPYLYSAAAGGTADGGSLVRPLYHEWPTEDAAFEHAGHFCLGDALVAAPVTRPMAGGLARGLPLWVPPGQWTLAHSGQLLRGPGRLSLAAALDEMPLLVRAGAVVVGQTPPEAEWPRCAKGAAKWLGRAQRLPLCMQVREKAPSRTHASL